MRVYISSTSIDLEPYRQAVISALSRTPHTVVCMEHKAAQDVFPLDECLLDVTSCDVYVGIFAWRYGFRPLSVQNLSITELEYRKAAECQIPTLAFLLHEELDWPDEFRDTGTDGDQIRALRHELQQNKWVRFFNSPDNLAAEVLAAITTQTDRNTHQESQAARNRIVGPVPEGRITHFQDRVTELRLLHTRLQDEGLRMTFVCGRGGSGKTALITKLIRSVEQDWCAQTPINEMDVVDSIVFVQLAEAESRSLDMIVDLISRTFEPNKASRLLEKWKNKRSVGDGLDMLFNEVLRLDRRVIVLDNFETILDDSNNIRDEFSPLRQFIEASLEFRHDAMIVVTSRRSLLFPPEIEARSVGLKHEMVLDAGLPVDAATALLKELDKDGSLGVRDVSEEFLEDVVSRCGCIPRTLEVLLGVLRTGLSTLEEFVTEEDRFTEFINAPERVVYTSLHSDEERRVMEVLSIYNRPVPAAAVRHALPGVPAEEILKRFRHCHFATYSNRLFSLHPLDQEYAYRQIPEVSEVYSRRALHHCAAEYYRGIPCPSREERTSIDDILPLLNTVEHLLKADDAEGAASLFMEQEIHEQLYWWGHYLVLGDLCSRILTRDVSSTKKVILHILLGKVQRNLNELEEAKRIYSEAIPLLDEADQESKIRLFIALGDISYYLSDMDKAIEYHRQAEVLLVATRNPALESENSGDLANALLGQGKFEEAQQYYEQAIALSRESGMRVFEGIWHGGLGNLHTAIFSRFNDSERRDLAISQLQKAIAIAKETKDSRHNSHWNGVLGKLYHQLGRGELAETHLREALVISSTIRYTRGTQMQIPWLVAIFEGRVQRMLEERDFAAALSTTQSLRQIASDMGIHELETESNRLSEGPRLHELDVLLREGLVDEAIPKGQEFLMTCSGEAKVLDDLGKLALRWGRLNASREALELSVEAHVKAIEVASDDLLGNLFAGRADAHALLGMAEEAIADYGEAIRRDPENTGAALSQAEVFIWLSQFETARDCLESLDSKLTTTGEKAISAWLMCHALNLSGRDFTSYRLILEEIVEAGDIGMQYGVRDIEPYLRKLDLAGFNREQIDNAWMIQSLMLKFTEPDASCRSTE